MKVKGDSTAIGSTVYLGDVTASEARSSILSQPTGTWFIHNAEISLIEECKYCGNKNCHAYIEGACWKCWRSRNPGLLSR